MADKLLIRAVAALSLLATLPAAADDKLIGMPASQWQVSDWINSKPLKLADLKGKVVLVRWWTAPDCPYCAATAPSLNEFHASYADRGLVVIGYYHHKGREALELESVQSAVEKFGFQFPVAVDHDWKTLNEWWLDVQKQRWTSVSFLIDRQGVIRHIHPGGQYAPGEKAYEAMLDNIEELLRQK